MQELQDLLQYREDEIFELRDLLDEAEKRNQAVNEAEALMLVHPVAVAVGHRAAAPGNGGVGILTEERDEKVRGDEIHTTDRSCISVCEALVSMHASFVAVGARAAAQGKGSVGA